MHPRLSFILATVCRPTLRRALDSILRQAEAGDEVLLVTDLEITTNLIQVNDKRVKMYHCPRSDDWGNPERRMAMQYVNGDYICIADDDDQFLPGALDAIKGAAALHLHDRRPLMFKMVDPDGRLLWQDKQVRVGNMGGPQFVVPTSMAGQWGLGEREADYTFLRTSLSNYEEGEKALVWVDTVIYGCRGWQMRPQRVEEK